MTPLTAPRSNRRGALLLLVLSVLTLFMLVGAVTLTMSTRARQTARATAKATAGTAAGPMQARVQLEEALLRLIRGKPTGDAGEGNLEESLLGDMYGTREGFTGEATSLVPQVDSPLVRASVTITGTASESASAAALSGRILTFKPASGSGDAVKSFRVLRAEGTGPFTCWLIGSTSQAKTSLPKVPCPILVNPPAFRDEAYDAFDDANSWLTQLELKNGAVVHVPRPAYAGIGATAEVDNDNDGVMDGIWKRSFLPSTPAPGALGELQYDVSYLVVDLDGRVNVNAHGTRTAIDYPASDWEGAPDVPLGSGYGPADVDASLIFTGSASLAATGSLGATGSNAWKAWKRTLGEPGSESVTGTSSTLAQRRPPPQVGGVQGRYGDSGKPGVANQNDPGSRRSELVHAYTSGTSTSAIYDPVVDPKAMMKVEMVASGSSPMPTLRYFLPDFNRARLAQLSGLGGSAKDGDLVAYYQREGGALHFEDDPYELQLHDDAPRPMELKAEQPSQRDNPFTLAELEAVLRQFDPDAGTLPPRLSTALDVLSQRSRFLITTDNWDTPALTGPVAQQIENYIKSLACDPASVMSPDVLAGLRLDINRPFSTDATAPGDFCKHLYMLLVALGQPPSRETAQWAANVLDYRDTDSVFTKFEFDTNPRDGWTPNDFVWGVERPEVVLAQTVAWRTNKTGTNGAELKDSAGNPIIEDGGLYISMYRPWNVEAIGSGAANGANQALKMSVDRLDPSLAADTDSSSLDLAKKLKGSNRVIWRLRFDDFQGTAKYVKFDSPSNNTDGEGFRSNVRDSLRLMKPDSYLVVQPTAPKGSSTSTVNKVDVPNDMVQFPITHGGSFRAEQGGGAGNEQPGADTMVYLERLADPSKVFDATSNPYVVVDKLGVKVVNRTGAYNSGQSSGPNNWRYYFRDPPFWRHRPFSHLNKELDISGNPKNPAIKKLDADATSWLPWSNRPYVSHAELLLVPRGDSLEMLTGYDIPQKPGFKCAQCGGIGHYETPGPDPSTSGTVSCTSCPGTGFAICDTCGGSGQTPGPDPSTPLTVSCTSCLGTGRPMLLNYHLPTPAVLDATLVPSRFSGTRLSVTPSALTPLGMQKIPYDQISRWREPGRVNLNTVLPNRECTDPSQDEAVWHAVIGDDAAVSRDEFASAGPAKNLAEMLTLLRDDGVYIDTSGTSSDPVRGKSWKKNRLYQMNPALAYATAIRLANVATVRSHVFAVWITLRVRDTTPGAHDAYHRLFAIVDRSRPAGYKEGQNLDVRETIRVLRYLD